MTLEVRHPEITVTLAGKDLGQNPPSENPVPVPPPPKPPPPPPPPSE